MNPRGGDGVEVTIEYGKIQVFDDLVPQDIYDRLNRTARSVRWQFGKSTKENPHARYWHFEIAGGQKANVEDKAEVVAAHPIKAFGEFQDWLRRTLVPPDTLVLRFYMNAHTYGSDGWPHRDTDRGDELTVVLYLNREWCPEWCGETAVFDANGSDIEAAVLPRPNRLLVFPSDRLHAPRPISRAYSGLRVVLVAKIAPARGGSEFFGGR